MSADNNSLKRVTAYVALALIVAIALWLLLSRGPQEPLSLEPPRGEVDEPAPHDTERRAPVGNVSEESSIAEPGGAEAASEPPPAEEPEADRPSASDAEEAPANVRLPIVFEAQLPPEFPAVATHVKLRTHGFHPPIARSTVRGLDPREVDIVPYEQQGHTDAKLEGESGSWLMTRARRLDGSGLVRARLQAAFLDRQQWPTTPDGGYADHVIVCVYAATPWAPSPVNQRLVQIPGMKFLFPVVSVIRFSDVDWEASERTIRPDVFAQTSLMHVQVPDACSQITVRLTSHVDVNFERIRHIDMIPRLTWPRPSWERSGLPGQLHPFWSFAAMIPLEVPVGESADVRIWGVPYGFGVFNPIAAQGDNEGRPEPLELFCRDYGRHVRATTLQSYGSETIVMPLPGVPHRFEGTTRVAHPRIELDPNTTGTWPRHELTWIDVAAFRNRNGGLPSDALTIARYDHMTGRFSWAESRDRSYFDRAHGDPVWYRVTFPGTEPIWHAREVGSDQPIVLRIPRPMNPVRVTLDLEFFFDGQFADDGRFEPPPPTIPIIVTPPGLRGTTLWTDRSGRVTFNLYGVPDDLAAWVAQRDVLRPGIDRLSMARVLEIAGAATSSRSGRSRIFETRVAKSATDRWSTEVHTDNREIRARLGISITNIRLLASQSPPSGPRPAQSFSAFLRYYGADMESYLSAVAEFQRTAVDRSR